MRILVSRPLFVLVTGMARSGTTLLASLLNSAENAVVLSEPHNCLRAHGYVRPDKLGSAGAQRQMRLGDIVPWLRESPYDLAGVKEVCEYTREGDCMLLDYAVDAADLILVMTRDPVETVASQKDVLGYAMAESLSQLSAFMMWVRRQGPRRPLRFLRYELLCADPLGYLNAVLEADLRIEGGLAKHPMEGFGDARGLESREIQAAPSRRFAVSLGERLAIEAVAGGWFEGLSGWPERTMR